MIVNYEIQEILLLVDLVIEESCNRRSNRERKRAKTEKKPDGLTGACRSADVEGDRPEHCDETAVEDAHDEAEDHHGLVDVAPELGSYHQQHRAEPDRDKGDLSLKVLKF